MCTGQEKDMTFASSSDLQVLQLRRELARSDERLKAMDKELQRVAGMIEKLYCLRYHEPPPRVRRSLSIDEDRTRSV